MAPAMVIILGLYSVLSLLIPDWFRYVKDYEIYARFVETMASNKESLQMKKYNRYNTKIQCQNFKNFIQLISLNIVQSEYFLYPKALLKYHQQNSFNSLSYKHIVIFTRTDRESAHVVLIFILHFHRPGLSLTCLGEKDFALRQNQINKKNAKIS